MTEPLHPSAAALSDLPEQVGGWLPPSAAVVGAGIAGLACAAVLAEGRVDVRVFERSRGAGGRAGTRRGEGGSFDHGAQCFTAETPRFQGRVRAWLAEGVVAEWKGRIADLETGRLHPAEDTVSRYVGVPGMSSLARQLKGLSEVETGAPVIAVERLGGRWQPIVLGVDGRVAARGLYDVLVLAVPPAEAAALVPGGGPLAERLSAVRMRPTWALLARFAEPVELAVDGAFVHGSPLAWAGRESSKPGRDGAGDSWVLHATHEWSEARLDAPGEEVEAALLAAFAAAAGRRLPPVAWNAAHRWRHARAATPLPEACLYEPRSDVGVCGDWCGGDGIEAAYLSGTALAERILSRLGGGRRR